MIKFFKIFIPFGEMMFLSIDLGSNTIRFAVMDKNLRIIKVYEKIIGSAKGVNKSKEISEICIQKLTQTLKQADEIFNFKTIKHQGVATGVWRVAKNAEKILKMIQDDFGINFKIISGKNEAKLTSFGVKNALNELGLSDKNCVFVDMGGASTEIANEQTQASFELGIITTFEKFNNIFSLKQNVKEMTKEAKSFLKGLKRDIIVLTSGVPTTMASFKLGFDFSSYDRKKINGYELKKDDFTTLFDTFLNLDEQKSVKILGEDRKMLVLAGIALLEEILSDENAKMIVVDDGLREGVGVAYHTKILDNFLKF
ncbi:disulfide bond formation protein DsbA [Campylobacter mucosalis]|uniref:Ppx/GppA phosphatase family protein n=1 Tax=Campylobacter mucosalis TaxID=202 RepID=UPI00147011BC|nr:disulfide bond formation protein DsbA [Campylobacter mucosalis]